MKKILAFVLAPVAGFAALAVAIAASFMVVIGGGGAAAGATCPGVVAVPKLPKITGGFDGWNASQVSNAARIVAVGRDLKLPSRAWVIAVATSIQESTLNNLGHLGDENDHDSLGLFQQRPSAGWGTPAQVRIPEYAAKKFYNKLVDVKGWLGMTLTKAAQKVQRSAFPGAYAKWEKSAEKLVAHVTGLPGLAQLGAGPPGAECGNHAAAEANPTASAGGWVNPVNAKVGGPFGEWRGDHMHAGVDLIASRHTPIYSAAAGTVIRVKCNSSNGNCDRDGSPSVRGCGWYAEVRHAGNMVTRYCHMVSRPRVEVGDRVAVGDLIGNVGSSGGSSGPHLHYEVHRNVPKGGYVGSMNATDPVKYHKNIGAPLGRRR